MLKNILSSLGIILVASFVLLRFESEILSPHFGEFKEELYT